MCENEVDCCVFMMDGVVVVLFVYVFCVLDEEKVYFMFFSSARRVVVGDDERARVRKDVVVCVCFVEKFIFIEIVFFFDVIVSGLDGMEYY